MGSKNIQDHQSKLSGPLLRKITDQELKQVLDRHKRWADGGGTGEQAEQGPADLSRTDLAGRRLAGADMRHVNLQGACLHSTDLRCVNLRDADLSGANLLGARLQEADLRNANLKEAKLLLSKQMAGADMAGAQLPGAILKFEGLEIVEQISRNARTIMFSMLLASVYTWLTIATATDPLLLTNSISSPLPIIRTEIPIAGFFWVAPLILLSLYLYFHIYLQRLWETLADLPAVFPDGSRLDKRAYPWLLNGLVTSHFKRLRISRPQFSRLQTGLSILVGWWTVPVTLLALWLRYLPRHDWLGTALHVALSIAAIGAGILFYRAATATLRREMKESLSWKQYLLEARGVKRLALILLMGVVFWGLSFGAIKGIPHNAEHAAGISAFDARSWVPRLMEALGNGTFADLIEEAISTKPANWVEKKGEKSNLGLIKGARLKKANLAYAQARSAFLVKGDLRMANLFGADLRNADLRLANLQGANLNSANLAGARLAGVMLQGTALQGVALENYDFYSANFKDINLKDAYLRNIRLDGTNLQGANFENAHLQKVNLGDTNLKNANFSKARLEGVSFFNANLERTQFFNTQGLTRNAIWKTANWIFAYFDKKSLVEFGLPADIQARIQNKNFSGMNLRAIYLLDLDLRNFNFHKSNLHEARFSRVDLREVDFSQSNLQKAKMHGDLGGVNFSRADLRQASIRNSNLSRANLQKANLNKAMLVEVDLRHADLAQADLRGITFGNWVKIDGANLKGVIFSGSHIRNARGLTCSQLQEAVIDNETRLPDYLDSCRR